jgi:hypothetical protein
VVAGKILVEGDPLPDGSIVTILAKDADETFELDAVAERALLESIAEADRGETVAADTRIASPPSRSELMPSADGPTKPSLG